MPTRGKATRETLLLKAIHAVTAGGSLKEVLDRLLSEALDGVNGRLGWVAVVEESGLRVMAVQGVSAPSVGDVIPFGKGLTGLAYETGRPYYAPDVSNEARYWLVSPEVKSEYLVPLVARGKVVGVLNVESSVVDGFGEGDREFVAALGELAAGAVGLTKRYEDATSDLAVATRSLEERVQALEAMSSAVRAISGSLNLPAVIRIILEKARDVIRADHAHLILRGPDGGFVMNTSTSIAQGTGVDIDRGITGWVIRNRRALLVPDVSLDRRYVAWHETTKSELAVPLIDGSEVTGVLNFESSRLSGFGNFHLELAETFAGHVAVAIKNATLYASLEAARRDLGLTEGLRAAGEVAGDIIHYVANKVGALPQTVRLIADKVRGKLRKEDEHLVLKLLELVGKAAEEVLAAKARVLDGTRTLEPERVALSPLVNEVVEQQSGQVTFTVSGDAETAVLADRHALRRLLDNVFANASKALAGTAGPEVRITWRRDGDQVEMEIRDNGPGFPDDILKTGLIPRFGTESESGTGLGLWLSERLASRMGGTLQLGNAPGGGAYVRVRLPVAR